MNDALPDKRWISHR